MQTLTQEEFEKKYGEEALNALTTTKQKQGFLSETLGDIKGVGSDIISSAKARSANVGEAMEAQAKGEQGLGRTIFQSVGQAAGLGSDIIGAGIKGTVKSLLTEGAEESVKGAVQGVGTAVINNPVAQSIIKQYQSLDDKTKRDIESVLGVTSLTADVAGLGMAGKGAKAGIKTTQQLAKAGAQKVSTLTDDVITKTKQIFTGSKARIGDQVIPIPKTVQTTLKRTSDDVFKKYVNQARLASIEQKASTPLELAGEKAVEALQSVQKKMSAIGAQKSSIVNQSNVGLKPVGNIAVKARQNILKEIGDKTLDATDQRLVNDVLTKLTNLGVNPKLKQVDEFIDYAQEILYKGTKNLTVPVGGRTERVIKNTITSLNNQIKDIAPSSYRNLNAQYAKMIDIRNTLNNALGSEASKGGSLMKRVFSPTDSGTKKLFEEIKKLTNIDLVDEATLAKFSMELFGDARQAMLLQQLNIPSKAGLIQKILETTGGALGYDDWIRNLRIKKATSLIKK
jgi:predicted pyridoxine 5'-phosphate oxidase superfamily flavin-nucleotide-binding protein